VDSYDKIVINIFNVTIFYILLIAIKMISTKLIDISNSYSVIWGSLRSLTILVTIWYLKTWIFAWKCTCHQNTYFSFRH